MMKSRVAVGATCAAALIFGAYMGGAFSHHPVKQPISFNHNKHIGLGIDCETCHPGVQNSRHAGMTSVKNCVTCHQAAQVSDPEAKKLENYLARGQEPPWKRIYRLPPERYNIFWRPYASKLFFSHRLHTKIAHISCIACHGDMDNQTKPLSFQKKAIRMNNCLNCHRTMSVSTDCLACHR